MRIGIPAFLLKIPVGGLETPRSEFIHQTVRGYSLPDRTANKDNSFKPESMRVPGEEFIRLHLVIGRIIDQRSVCKRPSVSDNVRLIISAGVPGKNDEEDVVSGRNPGRTSTVWKPDELVGIFPVCPDMNGQERIDPTICGSMESPPGFFIFPGAFSAPASSLVEKGKLPETDLGSRGIDCLSLGAVNLFKPSAGG